MLLCTERLVIKSLRNLKSNNIKKSRVATVRAEPLVHHICRKTRATRQIGASAGKLKEKEKRSGESEKQKDDKWLTGRPGATTTTTTTGGCIDEREPLFDDNKDGLLARRQLLHFYDEKDPQTDDNERSA